MTEHDVPQRDSSGNVTLPFGFAMSVLDVYFRFRRGELVEPVNTRQAAAEDKEREVSSSQRRHEGGILPADVQVGKLMRGWTPQGAAAKASPSSSSTGGARSTPSSSPSSSPSSVPIAPATPSDLEDGA